MTMDQLVAQTIIDSRDIAAVFVVQHDLVLDEIDDCRNRNCNRSTYTECWDGGQRHFEMDLTEVAQLVELWPISQLAEFHCAYVRSAAKGASLGF